MRRRNFNWVGFIAAILLSGSTSLLISLGDGNLEAVEFFRAGLQSVIAAVAFLTKPRIEPRQTL